MKPEPGSSFGQRFSIAGGIRGQSECRLQNGDRKEGRQLRETKEIEFTEDRDQLGGLLKLLGLHGGGIESEGLWNHWLEMFQKQLYKQICGQERGVNWTDE